MQGALKDSLISLKAWVPVFQSPSRMQKLANGTGAVGTRAVPTQNGTNDKTIGSRLDYGENIVKDGKEELSSSWRIRTRTKYGLQQTSR